MVGHRCTPTLLTLDLWATHVVHNFLIDMVVPREKETMTK